MRLAKAIMGRTCIQDSYPLLWTAILAFVLGGGLLVSSAFGAKWFLFIFLLYTASAVALFFRDIRLFGTWLLCACAPLGIQYQLWTHEKKSFILSHYGGNPPEPVINLVDFPLYFLVFVWLSDLASSKCKLPEWHRFDTLVLVFLFLSMLSAFNLTDSPDEYYLYIFEMLRYAKYYLLYWVLRTYMATPKNIYGFFGIALLLMVFQGLIACLQYFFYFQLPIAVGGVTGSQFLEMSGEVIQRVTGFLGHANTFAAYLLIPLSCAMVLLFSRMYFSLKVVVFPIFLFGVLTIVLTFSRNGWLSLVICACIVGLFAVARKSISPNLLIFAGVSAVFAIGIVYGLGIDTGFINELVGSSRKTGSPNIFSALYVRIFEDSGQAFDTRADLLWIAWRMISEHPFIGIGLNCYEEYMVLFDINGTVNVIQQPVHNTYALIAAETGIPSLALFLTLGGILIGRSYRIARSHVETIRIVGILGLCTYIGLGFANLFDVSFRKEPVLALIVIISALVMTCSSRGFQLPPDEPLISRIEPHR